MLLLMCILWSCVSNHVLVSLCTGVLYCTEKQMSFTPLIVLCARSCAKSCAIGLVCPPCADSKMKQKVCEPQTSSARCCADVVCVLCVVFGGDSRFGAFFGWSCALF